MTISIAELRAAGISDKQILDLLQEAEAKRREQNRIRQRNHRARNASHRDSHASHRDNQIVQQNQRSRNASHRDTPLLLTSLPSLLTNLPSIDRPLITAARARRRPLPDDWMPKGEQRDPTEADEFRDHAKAKGYQYIDWDAAYRNFQKSNYNARNQGGKNGHGRRYGSVLDAFDRIGERLRQAGGSDNYVPGSSGPRPLDLGDEVRKPGLKLIPKG